MMYISSMKTIPKVVLLVDASREYERGFLRGIARYLRYHGPWTFYRQPVHYLANGGMKSRVAQIKKWGADVVIAAEQKGIEEILSMGIPSLILPYQTKNLAGTVNVRNDSEGIGTMGAEYLLNKGFRNLAFCGYEDMFWSQDEQAAFARRVEHAGLAVHLYYGHQDRTNVPSNVEQKILAKWLKELPKPAGIMACNDDRSRDLLEAAENAGLQIPQDVAILGVDNDEMICELSNPPLSSIALNIENVGYEAAEAINKLLDGQKIGEETIIVKGINVVTRKSTDVLAIEDSEVAKAVHFIHEHGREIIEVQDVVDVTNLARRTLQQRFKKVLGRSVLEEIRRVRVNLVAQMLTETRMSVLQIARALNYPGCEHISRYFRKEKGMTLLEYRKKYGRQ